MDEYSVTANEMAMEDASEGNDTADVVENNANAVDATSESTEATTQSNADAAGQEGAEQVSEEAQAEAPRADAQAQGDESAKQPQNTGPNKDFATRRAEAEAAAKRAEIAAYTKVMAGMVNPETGKAFESIEAFNEFQMRMRVKTGAKRTGLTEEAYKAQEEQMREQMKAEFEQSPEMKAAKQLIAQAQVDAQKQLFSADIEAIKAAYPDEKAKDVPELGMEFAKLRAAGLDPITSYEAVRAKKVREGGVKAPSTGDVKSTKKSDPHYFTSEEVDRMSDAELDKHLDDINRSMKKW